MFRMENKKLIIFLQESIKKLKNNETNTDEIKKGLICLSPCYFNLLPCDIKRKIYKYSVKKDYRFSGSVKKITTVLKNINLASVIWGKHYKKELFNTCLINVFKVYKSIKTKSEILLSFLEKMNNQKIAIYYWQKRKNYIYCYLDYTDTINENMRQNIKFICSASKVTLHKYEHYASKRNNNYKSSFEESYVEGIFFTNDDFRPIHYVNKKPLYEFNF